MVDLPEGASLEDTERTLFAAADIARGLPEITSVQSYAGTPAPFNFNGLVRHYYLRERPELGELQVNLAARGDRKRASHDIALDLRQRLKAVAIPAGTSIKVVEVPPGPPVLATLLAEIYGPDAATRRAVTVELKKVFAEVPFIVDIDDSDRREAAAAAAVDRPGPARVLRRRAARRLRHHPDAVRRRVGRLFPPRRRPQSDRDRGQTAEARSGLDRGAGVDAGARQHAARQQDGRRTRPGRQGDRRGGLAGDLPPRRPLRRHGDGGTRGPLRGAALRHARGRQAHRRP